MGEITNVLLEVTSNSGCLYMLLSNLLLKVHLNMYFIKIALNINPVAIIVGKVGIHKTDSDIPLTIFGSFQALV